MDMKQSNLQTAILAAICVVAVLIFCNTRPAKTDPGEALRQTLSEMH